MEISTRLTIDSVLGTLRLADLHRACQLKKRCIEYIFEHIGAFNDTEKWSYLFTPDNQMPSAELMAELSACFAQALTFNSE